MSELLEAMSLVSQDYTLPWCCLFQQYLYTGYGWSYCSPASFQEGTCLISEKHPWHVHIPHSKMALSPLPLLDSSVPCSCGQEAQGCMSVGLSLRRTPAPSSRNEQEIQLSNRRAITWDLKTCLSLSWTVLLSRWHLPPGGCVQPWQTWRMKQPSKFSLSGDIVTQPAASWTLYSSSSKSYTV